MRGEAVSGVMGVAVMVPGVDTIFWDVSRSTRSGVLPNLTAVPTWRLKWSISDK